MSTFQSAKCLPALRELMDDVRGGIGAFFDIALKLADGIVQMLARLGDLGAKMLVLQLQVADFAAVTAWCRLAVSPSFDDAPDEGKAEVRRPFPSFLPEHVAFVDRGKTPHAEGFTQKAAQGIDFPVGKIQRVAVALPANVLVLQ